MRNYLVLLVLTALSQAAFCKAADTLTEEAIKRTHFEEVRLCGTTNQSREVTLGPWYTSLEDREGSNFCLRVTVDTPGLLRVSPHWAFNFYEGEKESLFPKSPVVEIDYPGRGALLDAGTNKAYYIFLDAKNCQDEFEEMKCSVLFERPSRPLNDRPEHPREIVLEKGFEMKTVREDASLAREYRSGNRWLWYVVRSGFDCEIMLEGYSVFNYCDAYDAIEGGPDLEKLKASLPEDEEKRETMLEIDASKSSMFSSIMYFRQPPSANGKRFKIRKDQPLFIRISAYPEEIYLRIWNMSPPQNDSIKNPRPLALGAFMPATPVATWEKGECILHKNSVWYQFKPDFSGHVRILGHDRLSIYRDATGKREYSGLEAIVEDNHGEGDRDGFGKAKPYILKVEAGKEYLLCFYGQPRNVTAEKFDPPENDSLADAKMVAFDGKGFFTDRKNMALATREEGEKPWHGHSIWYDLRPDFSGHIITDLAKEYGDVAAGLALAVYECPKGMADFASLRPVYEEPKPEPGKEWYPRHRLNFAVEKGRRYLVCWHNPMAAYDDFIFRFRRVSVPENDNLSQAKRLVLKADEPLKVECSTLFSTREALENSGHECGVWYEIACDFEGEFLLESSFERGRATIGVYEKNCEKEGYAGLNPVLENWETGKCYLPAKKGLNYLVCLGTEEYHQGPCTLSLRSVLRPRNFIWSNARPLKIKKGQGEKSWEDNNSQGLQQYVLTDLPRESNGSWFVVENDWPMTIQVTVKSEEEGALWHDYCAPGEIPEKPSHDGSGTNTYELAGRRLYLLWEGEKGGPFTLSIREITPAGNRSYEWAQALELKNGTEEIKLEVDSSGTEGELYYALETDFDGEVEIGHKNGSVHPIAIEEGKLEKKESANLIEVSKGIRQYFMLEHPNYDLGPDTLAVKKFVPPKNHDISQARELIFKGERLEVKGDASPLLVKNHRKAENQEDKVTLQGVWYRIEGTTNCQARLFVTGKHHDLLVREKTDLGGLKTCCLVPEGPGEACCNLEFSPGRTYYVCVSGREFILELAPIEAASNGAFARAEILEWDGKEPKIVEGNAILGGREDFEPLSHANTVWYALKPAFSGTVRVDDLGFFLESGYYARLSVYKAGENPENPKELKTVFESLAFASDGMCNFNVAAGETCYLCFDLSYFGKSYDLDFDDWRDVEAWKHASHRQKDSFSFCLKKVEPPKNDNLKEAEPLFFGATNVLSMAVDTGFATREAKEPANHRNTVWYSLRTAISGHVTINGGVTVYEGTASQGLEALRPLNAPLDRNRNDSPMETQILYEEERPDYYDPQTVYLEAGKEYQLCCDGPKGHRAQNFTSRHVRSTIYDIREYYAYDGQYILELKRTDKPQEEDE